MYYFGTPDKYHPYVGMCGVTDMNKNRIGQKKFILLSDQICSRYDWTVSMWLPKTKIKPNGKYCLNTSDRGDKGEERYSRWDQM